MSFRFGHEIVRLLRAIAPTLRRNELLKIAKFLVIATFIVAPALTHVVPASAQAPAASPALPDSWDAKIPLPPGAVLIDSTVPKAGVVHSANFAVTQDYQQLVDFYLKELPKAKFAVGPKLAAPARKVFDLSFLKGDMLDNLTISPSEKDPSKMNLHIAWTPDSAKKKAATP
jgi:hypothetical protein